MEADGERDIVLPALTPEQLPIVIKNVGFDEIWVEGAKVQHPSYDSEFIRERIDGKIRVKLMPQDARTFRPSLTLAHTWRVT